MGRTDFDGTSSAGCPKPRKADTEPHKEEGGCPANVASGRFPTMVDLLALLGIWYLLQFVALLAAKLCGLDFPGWELLRGQVEPTAAEQIALARFSAFVYMTTLSLMIVCTLLYRRLRRGPRKVLRFSARGLDPVLLLWGLAMMLAAGVVIEPLLELLPQPSVGAYGRGFWAILSLVIAAPLLEEILCRGIVLESVRARYGVTAALFLSAAFFGVLHGQSAAAVNAFVMGLILGFIYIRTDSIFSTVLLHMLNNAVAFLLVMAGLEGRTLRSLVGSDTVYVAIYAGASVLFVASGWMIFRQLAKLRGRDKKASDA